ALDAVTAHIAWKNESARVMEDRARKFGLASEEDLQAAGRDGVVKRVANGYFERLGSFAELYYGPDWSKEPALRAAAETKALS
ncbi:hypothetical protein ABTJ72_18960, partial [Acinetobacter baumannii]